VRERTKLARCVGRRGSRIFSKKLLTNWLFIIFQTVVDFLELEYTVSVLDERLRKRNYNSTADD